MKPTPLAKMILDYYRADTRGAESFMTDKMKRAMVAQAAVDVILARYEVEAERENHTCPNVYADAVLEAEKILGLRD